MKRIVISIAVFCLIISACSRERAWKKQVEVVKEYIPEAIEFIENNDSLLDSLLDVKQRIAEYNKKYINAYGENKYNPVYYDIYLSQKTQELVYRSYFTASKDYENNLQEQIFTESDENIILAIFQIIQLKDDDYYISIHEDSILIVFANYNTATLFIESPPQDIDDTEGYSWYTYAKHVTDDWGIYLRRWNMGT
jgi:hypothetical protein